MDEKKLKALAAERAKGLKTVADLNAFSRMLTKFTGLCRIKVSLLTLMRQSLISGGSSGAELIEARE